MARLGDIALKIRSKNAGPFWLTVDIFAGSTLAFEQINTQLSTDEVARVFQANTADIRRFSLPNLNVVKLSLPRPEVQGSLKDRDMHGASWAALVAEIMLAAKRSRPHASERSHVNGGVKTY